MSAFCVHCGAPLASGSPFCSGCGKPSSPNQVVATPPKAGSSSALKIVLIVVCVAVIGLSAVSGVLYLAHRVKQAMVETAAANGVDLHSITNTSSESKQNLPPVCSLLTKEQVSELISQPIERSEAKDAACMYYGPAGLSARLAQEKASSTYKRAQGPGSNVNASEAATAADQLVNNMLPQTGPYGEGGDLPLLMIMLDADGKSQMTAIIATRGLFGGLSRGAANGNLPIGSDVPGLGDRAMFMPKLGLNVLQGNTFLRIIPGPFPDSDTRTISVARAILPKI